MCAPAIRMLGEFTVEVRGEPGPPFPTRDSEHLLAYLLLRPGTPQDREVLAGTLWGERSDPSARKSLRSALWRLRATLASAGIDPDDWFVVEARRIWFRAEAAVHVDVHRFRRAVEPLSVDGSARLGSDDAARLAEGAALYRGRLLPGVYEEWALQERERLHLLFLLGLERLVAHHEAGRDWERVLRIGLGLLQEDPFREPVHRSVMRSHAALGDRPTALRHFDRLVEILDRELGVEPMPETRALCEAIRRLSRPASGAGGDARDAHALGGSRRRI